MSKKKNKQPTKRNPIQQMHIEQNRKAGSHKDRKKEQNKKACRGRHYDRQTIHRETFRYNGG